MTDARLAADLNAVCRLTGVFKLRSGQTATEYFDKCLFESDPVLLRRVAEAMVPLIPTDTELLGGLELGGVPLATVVSQISGIPAVFVRKEPKAYGTCRLAEGAELAGGRIALIEDVVTTGGAVRNAAVALRGLGAGVHTVVCAIDRSSDGVNPLADINLVIRSVLSKNELDATRGCTRADPSHGSTSLQ